MGNKHSMERCKKVQHIAVYLLLLASFLSWLEIIFCQDDQHAGAAAHHVQPRGEDEGPRDWRDDPPRRHRRGRDGQLQRVGHHDDLHLGCGRGEMFNFSAHFDCFIFLQYRVIFAERFSKFDEVSVNKSFCWMLENVFMKLRNPF